MFKKIGNWILAALGFLAILFVASKVRKHSGVASSQLKIALQEQSKGKSKNLKKADTAIKNRDVALKKASTAKTNMENRLDKLEGRNETMAERIRRFNDDNGV